LHQRGFSVLFVLFWNNESEVNIVYGKNTAGMMKDKIGANYEQKRKAKHNNR